MNLKKAVQAHALSMGLLIGWLLTGLSVLAAAQEEPLPPPPPPVGGMVTMQVGPGFAGGFVHEEMADGRVVKGAPMTANVTMTRDTTLGDGNTIHTENQTTIYRDSQGRVRREIGFELNTPTTGAAKGTMIAITDPVSGNRYMLNPQNKTAHQMPFPPPMRARVSEGEASGGEAPSWVSSKANEENVSTEQLGTKTILGLSAVGTRVIRTIAAGQIGNRTLVLYRLADSADDHPQRPDDGYYDEQGHQCQPRRARCLPVPDSLRLQAGNWEGGKLLLFAYEPLGKTSILGGGRERASAFFLPG
jgi:hypothetical protein